MNSSWPKTLRNAAYLLVASAVLSGVLTYVGHALGQNCPDGSCPLPTAPPTWRRAVTTTPDAEYHGAVVRVSNWMGNSANSGSGVLIAISEAGSGIVLTNSHVIGETVGKIEVYFQDGEVCRGKLLSQDDQLDLAAIQITPPEGAPFTPVAEAQPRKGDQVEVCCFSGGRFHHFLSRVAGQSSNGEDLVVSAHVVSGNSGGPILDRSGRVVAILWGGTAGQGNRTADTRGAYCTPIRSFLGRLGSRFAWACPPRNRPPVEGPLVLPGPGVSPPGEDGPPAVKPGGRLKQNPELAAVLARIEARLDALEQAGVAGPRGPAGPPGPRGEPGSSAVAIASIDARLQSLEATNRKPLRLQVLDASGKVKAESQAYLGGAPLRLQLVPVSRR